MTTKKLYDSLNIEVFEKDGNIYADVNGEDYLLASEKDIEVKTPIALNNIISEIMCDLENFGDRPNINALISGEFEDSKNLKKGRK